MNNCVVVSLAQAIENLYRIFATYEADDLSPANPRSMDAPKLKDVRAAVLAKPLRALDAEDLLDYYYLAVDHIGDADDLRHFLPRLLEVIVSPDDKLLAAEHLPTLLASAGAATWPAAERLAIATFAQAAARLLPPEIRSHLLKMSG